MDNLKLVITIVLFIVVAIFGVVYFEVTLGVPRLVWGGPPFVLFLIFVIWPKWGGYDKPRKIMAVLLLIPITLLIGGVIIDAYVWELFDYSSIYFSIAMTPSLIYSAWYTLTIKRKQGSD